jgi:hypothetical protein
MLLVCILPTIPRTLVKKRSFIIQNAACGGEPAGERRRDLSDRTVLTVDGEGDEVIVGFAGAESRFYLNVDEDSRKANDAGERQLFID